MARRLRILDEYAGLCSLMERWVIHQMKSVTGGLGYPRKSLDFSYIQSPASSIDPTGYSAEDHTDTDLAFESLCKADPELAAAIKMHYMPWTVEKIKEMGYPFSPDKTYYNRLKRAHAWLDSELRQIFEKRREKYKEYA